MIIRIFIPEIIYLVKSTNSSKCYHIFGEIVNDSSGEYISIFIVDICERLDDLQTPGRQLIGTISNVTSDIEHLLSDYITFKVDEIKSVLEIKTLHLPNFIATSTSSTFNTQILLYDSKTFLELSHRNDEQKWCHRQDPISQLLLLIKNRDDFKKNEHLDIAKFDRSRNRIILLLISLSMFCETKLAFLNSSFLKHLQFWTTNLEKLTHKK